MGKCCPFMDDEGHCVPPGEKCGPRCTFTKTDPERLCAVYPLHLARKFGHPLSASEATRRAFCKATAQENDMRTVTTTAHLPSTRTVETIANLPSTPCEFYDTPKDICLDMMGCLMEFLGFLLTVSFLGVGILFFLFLIIGETQLFPKTTGDKWVLFLTLPLVLLGLGGMWIGKRTRERKVNTHPGEISPPQYPEIPLEMGQLPEPITESTVHSQPGPQPSSTFQKWRCPHCFGEIIGDAWICPYCKRQTQVDLGRQEPCESEVTAKIAACTISTPSQIPDPQRADGPKKHALRCMRCGSLQREGDWEKAIDAQARAMGSGGFINLSAPVECLQCGSTDLIREALS